MDNNRTGLGVVQAIIQATHALPDIPHLVFYPHNSNPRPASAAALLRQELAATSAAGALDADSKGSDATAE